jgi:hypothetical protein
MRPASTQPASALMTVVIPARNRPELLERALRSVFEGQNERPPVIVSDNSAPECPEIEALRSKYPFSYVRQTGQLTMFEHHSACVRLAATPWAFLLHDDDELCPGAVDKVKPLLDEARDLGAVIGGVEYINEEGATRGSWVPGLSGRFNGEEIVLRLGLDYRVCPPGILWNIAALNASGGLLDSNGTPNEQVVVLKMAFSPGVMLVDSPLGRYRIWGSQATDLSSPERAEFIVDCTIHGALAVRDIGISPLAADRLTDYMVWWIFRYAVPLFSKNPRFVVRLCQKCERVTPANGLWRDRVRREYPFLFWKPRLLAALLCAAVLSIVPRPVRRSLYRSASAVTLAVGAIRSLL